MRRKGAPWLLAGALLLLLALGLTGKYLWTARQAGRRAASAAAAVADAIAQAQDAGAADALPDYLLNPQMDMPELTLSGARYIGLLEIPALGLQLPVQRDWEIGDLDTAPCRYAGSAYLDNLVLCGHNYPGHFRPLLQAAPGMGVTFTDVDGSQFCYTVAAVERLGAGDVDEMISGGWALTLFTCTPGGAMREAVRCTLAAGA